MTEPLPDWFLTPPGGWTADDMDDLPPGAPRMELIDGALVLLSPQNKFHGKVMVNLLIELQRSAPENIDIMHEMTMKLGAYQRPEPDIVVYRFDPESEEDWRSHSHIPPEDVLIVIEIVSPESRERDRTTKPMKYAAAGIPHFWRIEREDEGPAIHVYELDGTAAPRYVPITIARERLKLDVPFPIDIDVRALDNRR
ncbi:Uma2 family endonuclease [Nocardiopsis alba]|uniref:Restriction endonuclease family protein n=1 Tax=Nocardiopsis alba (strain ATCC BAA-2165 / BE74) TaxID=1205910 RepID=J7L857_NOCAA|nr:Uma2 family endonuclease [Nocardiopsis alba]AFR06989.1 restriction endonuclease family protein [Nocardiopsis alba ATCC BAA-2165]